VDGSPVGPGARDYRPLDALDRFGWLDVPVVRSIESASNRPRGVRARTFGIGLSVPISMS
jgi:hypothetical protein